MKTTVKDVRITLSRQGQVIAEGDLRQSILSAFLMGTNEAITTEFAKETLVTVKVNLAGEEFVFEIPASN